MKKIIPLLFLLSGFSAMAQAPVQWNSSEILLALKKLRVLGAVLYVAAHPDDENTRLLAYFSKGKLYRTGYLSLTRGDGGQNLIGDEQGVELGLIRTQELLAARRIDGAEQFFTRAYDFGFSKSTEEATGIWGKNKVLADVVWVIRKFQPEVIITRFPGDSRAGHGHHSASAVLAREAFAAAADPLKFPEQLKSGVQVWKAKRILWNTFNFGSVNATAENQFKIDVGDYQPLLGKSFGEIAAESRSQHKSQGFGVPSSRGQAFEYFIPLEGDAPVSDLFDGVNTGWDKIPGGQLINAGIDKIIAEYNFEHPEKALPALISLYKTINDLPGSYWKTQKLKELQVLIRMVGGIYIEASGNQEYAVHGDSIQVSFSIINRMVSGVKLNAIHSEPLDTILKTDIPLNRNFVIQKKYLVPFTKPISQPYWLEDEMDKGSFNVSDQQFIGLPENQPSFTADVELAIGGVNFVYTVPVQYKHTDPVKGELFQPIVVAPQVSINTSPGVLLFNKGKSQARSFNLLATAYSNVNIQQPSWFYQVGTLQERKKDSGLVLTKSASKNIVFPFSNKNLNGSEKDRLMVGLNYVTKNDEASNYLAMSQINYDHIPPIRYFYPDGITVLNIPFQKTGKNIGYIKGAGDKVPEALEQMGFAVSFLTEQDMKAEILQKYDAVVTGIRAYNIHSWLTSNYEVLMDYVKKGGNLVVQYNTNSFAGPLSARISPYAFEISRNRVTDENSEIKFVDNKEALLNRPNRITQKDFEGWVQERGIYFAEKLSPEFRTVLEMKDPGEKENMNGSLVVAQLGKGRFIYTGLAFFRQLPAGVPGAYRLFANIVSNPNLPINAAE
jgi:LmbE family N-acetylglucosaminyl deacetylase